MRATGQCRPKPAGPVGSGPACQHRVPQWRRDPGHARRIPVPRGTLLDRCPQTPPGPVPGPGEVGPGWLYRAADGQQPVFVMTGEPARKPWRIMSVDSAPTATDLVFLMLLPGPQHHAVP